MNDVRTPNTTIDLLPVLVKQIAPNSQAWTLGNNEHLPVFKNTVFKYAGFK